VRTLLLFLVTLTRNAKSQEIFKLNSLNHIIIKVELYRAQIGLTQCYNCQNIGHVWANCKQPPNFCGAVVATCTENAPKRRIHNLLRAAAIAPYEGNYIQLLIQDAATRKENCRGEEHNELLRVL
jgi:hypothetical protein